jgi:hypothetical protein
MRTVFALFLLLTSSVSGAQVLWKQAEVGMSPAQVQAAFPEARQARKFNALGDGSKELLQIDNIEVASGRFEAQFFFMGDRLKQVTLHLSQPGSADRTEILYDEIVVAMRAKYGAVVEHDKTGGMMQTMSDTWMSGGTNISMYYNNIAGAPPLLNISYQVRVAQAGSNL